MYLITPRQNLLALCGLLLTASLAAQTPTPVPVLTWRYDLTHAGGNTQETALTPANVNVQSFGKLFSLSVDSTVYAQPLYVPGLTMSDGLVHNVLYVATENDSVYAFDADSASGPGGKPIWHVSLLDAAHGAGANATAVPWQDTGSPDVAPTIGITGTPAINPATNTLYLVAATKENGIYYSRLHAINIITGAEQPDSPVAITATAQGTGNGSSGGKLTFSPLWENQRPALDYYNGYVYIGYSSHGDLGPWHGWLFAYNAGTLKQSAALCLSPNGEGAGIWAAGAGLPIDPNPPGGRLFVVTANGTVSSYPPFSESSELGQSIVEFNLSNGGLGLQDAFTPYDAPAINTASWDLGSGGILMLPNQQGAYPHILLQGGKEGSILLLNRDKLGGYLPGSASNTTALQDITGITPKGKGFWNTPAYWNGHVYLWPEQGLPMMFALNNGVMNTQPSSVSAGVTSNFPTPSFSVSSDGTQDGIAWAVRSDQFNNYGAAVLYAWDATDLTKPIYESDSNAQRDLAGPANKFSIPVVTNGKVYVAANGQVDVYGLLNYVSPPPAPPPPSPSFSVKAGAIAALSAGQSGTSPVTVTPSGGFTGSVKLTCSLTSAPAGTAAPPACSVAQLAPITGSQAVTATLTISTTSGSAPAASQSGKAGLFSGALGSLFLAAFVCWVPRRRRWQGFAALLLLVVSGALVSGCGSKLQATSQAKPATPGTSPGSYTITVTGSSGSITETAPMSFTVQ